MLDQVQVYNVEGKSKINVGFLRVIRAECNKGLLKTVGIIRDADNSAEHASQSLCSKLSGAGFIPPGEQLIPSVIETNTGKVTSLYYIFEKNGSGMLEDLCYTSVEGYIENKCIQSFINCVEKITVDKIHEIAKTRCYSYITVEDEPDIRVGLAAKKGYWNLNHPCFDPLIHFLELLMENNPALQK